MLEKLIAGAIIGVLRLLTGVQARWVGCGPASAQRVYFANHTSHVDFLLIWCALPPSLRRQTRPVAAADYWDHGLVRRFLIHRVFRGVLIPRGHFDRAHNPIAILSDALKDGGSLIFFPEGTRGPGEQLQPFKPGIYHLAQARPDVELVPVWVDNSYRVMPKGTLFPIPLLCSVAFGEPTRLAADTPRDAFLSWLRQSLLRLGAE
jgi:1-acyl-sn-glycerol-3-phosphate acyltransferase